MVRALKKARAEDVRPSVSYSLGDSLNLRLLIHYVGDIHQPLHAVSRYTDSFPNGDEGGNLFMIPVNAEIKELHALWDSVVTKFGEDLALPLNESDWQFLTDKS